MIPPFHQETEMRVRVRLRQSIVSRLSFVSDSVTPLDSENRTLFGCQNFNAAEQVTDRAGQQAEE